MKYEKKQYNGVNDSVSDNLEISTKINVINKIEQYRVKYLRSHNLAHGW
jgi:hypothetical protein